MCSILFLSALYFLIHGAKIIHEKTIYYYYHRVQGIKAEVLGYLTIIAGVFLYIVD
jgi:hypothetical protein